MERQLYLRTHKENFLQEAHQFPVYSFNSCQDSNSDSFDSFERANLNSLCSYSEVNLVNNANG